MSTSSYLIRLLLCCSIFLFALTQSFASKTTWTGPGNNWSTPTNWDNGVPTSLDSAVITGGTSASNINVLISSPVLALHVTVDDHCILSVLNSASLTIVDAPQDAITINEKGSYFNYGTTNVELPGVNGIRVFGKWENYGLCNINNTNQGIIFMNDALGINDGELKVITSNFGMNNKINSQFTNTNTGKITVDGCDTSLNNEGTFTNNGDIFIYNTITFGLYNTGLFINNDYFLIFELGINSQLSTGIYNQTLTNATAIHVGSFRNNGYIDISEVTGTAIKNTNYTTFLNNSSMIIYTVIKDGIVNMPLSTFTMSADSELDMFLIYGCPLDTQLGSVFDIAQGAYLNLSP